MLKSRGWRFNLYPISVAQPWMHMCMFFRAKTRKHLCYAILEQWKKHTYNVDFIMRTKDVDLTWANTSKGIENASTSNEYVHKHINTHQKGNSFSTWSYSKTWRPLYLKLSPSIIKLEPPIWKIYRDIWIGVYKEKISERERKHKTTKLTRGS